MRTFIASAVVVCLSMGFTTAAKAENVAKEVKQAVEKCTLDQQGTKPFHLKAVYAPSRERDKASHREGEIEYWWESPTRWRREVRSPEFHQVAIVDGTRQWQKNEGDYFPEWLRVLALAIVKPVPLPMEVLLQRVEGAEVRHMRLPTRVNGETTVIEQTNFTWEPAAIAGGDAAANGKGYLALMNGQLFYTGGPGWSGLYHDFKDFHGRRIARTVASGRIEVTAKIDVLEDLPAEPPAFFDVNTPGGDAQLIETQVLEETDLRKNLADSKPAVWPALTDGPLEGTVSTEVVVDRTGKIREMNSPVADNPGVVEAAQQRFAGLHFQPFLRNGVPVQVTARLSEHFKTVRPAGIENFDSAHDYFERGRKTSFLAAGATQPYRMEAKFEVGTSSGTQVGRYEDTWLSETEWRRELWLGTSHLVRSQVNEQRYVLAEGPEANVLRMVMMVIEPIPAGDTMTESDWRIRRDTVDGVNTIRVARGAESPTGEFDRSHFNGYWFDGRARLVKAYVNGLEVRPSQIEAYEGVQVARQIDVLSDGKMAMQIIVTQVGVAESTDADAFKLRGHEWERAFTAEVR